MTTKTLPREIVDYIFELTDDVKTCVMNRRHYVVYKLYTKRGKHLIFQNDPEVIKYYFRNLLPLVVQEFKNYPAIAHIVYTGDLSLLKLVIEKVKYHRIFTKNFRFNIIRAFEVACTGNYLDIVEYLNKEYNNIVRNCNFRWLSEKVIFKNNTKIISFLYENKYLFFSYRGMNELTRIGADDTIQFLEKIKQTIPVVY